MTPVSSIIRSALQRLDRADSEEAGRIGASYSFRDLTEIILGAVEGRCDIPDEIVRDAALQAAAQKLEHRMLGAILAELSVDGVDRPVSDVLPILEGFWRVRVRLAGPIRAPEPTDIIPLGWETLELAHDFRSPLTSILFLADTLRRGQSGAVSELQHRQLGIIYSAALGLVSLANDVIGLTHRGDQLMDRQPSIFSLRELFESIVDVVQPIADDRKLSLRLLVQATDRRVGHPAILSRIFLNLTTNALKYTDEGMVELMARETTGDRIEFSVRDTGRGLDEETIAHLYEPFKTRSDGKGPSLDSYGLGLTICKKLVQAVGTDLHYETSRGWGTRFFFEIPVPVATAP